jgi:hypothetical protein
MATVNVKTSPYGIIHIHVAITNTDEIEEISSFILIRGNFAIYKSEMK